MAVAATLSCYVLRQPFASWTSFFVWLNATQFSALLLSNGCHRRWKPIERGVPSIFSQQRAPQHCLSFCAAAATTIGNRLEFDIDTGWKTAESPRRHSESGPNPERHEMQMEHRFHIAASRSENISSSVVFFAGLLQLWHVALLRISRTVESIGNESSTNCK